MPFLRLEMPHGQGQYSLLGAKVVFSFLCCLLTADQGQKSEGIRVVSGVRVGRGSRRGC